MGDYRDGTRCALLGKDGRDRTDNPLLGDRCRLPPANGDRRVGKELVHDPLELGHGEIAGCRAVMLTEVRHVGDGEPKVSSQESGAIYSFLLRATVNRRNLGNPGLPQEPTHACQPLRRQ